MQRGSFYYGNSRLRHSWSRFVWQLNAPSNRLCTCLAQLLTRTWLEEASFNRDRDVAICPSRRTGSSCTQHCTHSFHWLPAELLPERYLRGYMSRVHKLNLFWLLESERSGWQVSPSLVISDCIWSNQKWFLTPFKGRWQPEGPTKWKCNKMISLLTNFYCFSFIKTTPQVKSTPSVT